MKKIFLSAIAFAVVLTACERNEFDLTGQSGPDAPEYITVGAPSTKVHLDGFKTSWHQTDRISLFAKSDAMHYYRLDALEEENAQRATFKYVEKATDATMVLDKNYCIYPDRGVTNGVSDNTVNAEGILTSRIVYGQKYSSGNLLDYAPMVAVSDDYDFQFRNVASVLRFNIKKSEDFSEDCVLNKITLTSATQYLSGTLSVDTRVENPVARCNEKIKNKTVELIDVDVKLTAEAQPFCIVVFPTTYPSGDLTITLVYNDDQQKSVVYPQELSLGAGNVQDVNCTIKPQAQGGDQTGVTVTTGGIYKFNGHPHLSCYTASVLGSVQGENITEKGVLYQRVSSASNAQSLQSEQLLYENIDGFGAYPNSTDATNKIKKTTSTSEDGDMMVKLTNLAGGDGPSTYIYRFYAKQGDDVIYGEVKTLKTERYGQFVSVPAGTFTMGTDDAALGYVESYKTSPAHQVTLTTAFEIGKYEVSAKEFAAFLNAVKADAAITESPLSVKYSGMNVYRTGSSANSNGVKYENSTFKESDKKKPVTGVTYWGALKYCEWLSGNDDTYDYRLPTEAEWEWAARGADKSEGYKFSGSDNLAEVGNCKENNSNTMGRSGEKYPNELGIYDMSGNAWEIVGDRSDYNWLDADGNPASYYLYCKDGVTDPSGPAGITGYSFTNGKFYFIRKGGSTNDSVQSNFCPSYRRTDNDGQQGFHTHMGFRVVRVKKN